MKVIPRSDWSPSFPKSVIGAEDIRDLLWFREKDVRSVAFTHPGESLLFVESSPFQYLNQLAKADWSQRGYGDIAYNLAVATNVEGVICCRGLVNKSPGFPYSISVLCLIGREEPPTDLFLQNLSSCRDFVLSKYPKATDLTSSLPFQFFADLDSPKESSQFTCSLPNTFIQETSVHVFDLIENLAYWGYYKARNAGVYDEVTQNAVAALQADLKDGGLYHKKVDGLYGRYTREAFCNYMRSLK